MKNVGFPCVNPTYESGDRAGIETIDKLRQFGLSDEQIASALELPLEVIKQLDLEG